MSSSHFMQEKHAHEIIKKKKIHSYETERRVPG